MISVQYIQKSLYFVGNMTNFAKNQLIEKNKSN